MIRANFTAYGHYVTDGVNQWDINHTLRVTGLNLTSAPEVHFSNANVDRAIVRQSTMTDHVVEVSIPNSLLQDPLTIKAHIGVYDGGTFKVVELVEIPVKPRKRPMDYRLEASDDEVYSFKALENALANNYAKIADAKVDKNGVAQITMSMLSQEVKTSMTGGSVPVVGNGAVSTANIVDASVTEKKLALSAVAATMFSNDETAYTTPLIIVRSEVVNGGTVMHYELNEAFTANFNIVTATRIFEVNRSTLVLVTNDINTVTIRMYYDPIGNAIHLAYATVPKEAMIYLGGTYSPFIYSNNIVPVQFNDTLILPKAVEVKPAKTASFLGDSITTYAGYVPAGNAVYYNGANCGVWDVKQTWWQRVLLGCGLTLNTNNAWSGSRVTNTDANTTSAVARATKLDNGTDPDVIFIYMGINDFNNNVALGTYDGKGMPPTEESTFREAYAVMLRTVLSKYTKAKVYALTLPPCQRNDIVAGHPEYNGNGVYLSEFNNAIAEVCQAYHVEVIDTASCGLSMFNASVYMGDNDSSGGFLHPNAEGHRLIADKVIRSVQ